ncbi:type II secretion system secretin GspD [Sphingomonas bacterium]|uniref:type II secretion system secretin GspD n=1 Tax=Sphingomonas bacterium TaxID=1895847 RepID=UPI001576CEA4|nr:type II secretion system secretin GspD [Sphingomonas bacterium]
MRRILLASALVLAPVAVPLRAVAQTTLNVRDADMRAFIADAARVTGRTFIIDGRVQGKVTVVTDHPLSRSEYFEVFLSTLRANALVAVPTGNGALRIQPIDNAAQAPTRVGTAGAARNSLVTDIVRLRSIDAASALDTVRPLVSQQGSVTANRTGNTLVIVDFADNVRRVREVLRRIDGDNQASRVVTLRNAGARDIAAALQGFAGSGGGGGGGGSAAGAAANGGGGLTTTVSAVESSNSILLRGDPRTVARLAGIAEQLDQKARNGTEIKVVFLENADAEQMLPVLQQLVGQTPDQIPQTTLSRGSFSQASASGSAGGTGAGVIQQPVFQQQAASAPGGGGGANGSTAAVQTQGGRTAAVVTRFAGANAIVIAGPVEVQRQLADVIRQLDTRREQVEVEAVVAEVSDAVASQLGAQVLLGNLSGGAFAATSYSNAVPNLLTIAGAIGARQLNTTTTTINGATVTTSTNSTISDTLAQSALSSILGSSGGFVGAAGKFGSTILGAIVNAVKTDTASNLLQTPHLITLDNQQAHLLVGQEIPITTGQAVSLASANSDNAFRTVQRENVGIQLDVKPQINSSGSIKLYLRQEVSSIAGPVSAGNQELILNKRAIENTFTIDDGQIVVIGGLLSDEERRTIEKTPVLGDLPVVGNLFRSKARSRTKTNLMVFIRPTILRTPEDSRRLTEQRYGYLRSLEGEAQPGVEPSIDQLVREYVNASPPTPPAPMRGNIETPTSALPVARPLGSAPGSQAGSGDRQ